MIKVAGLFWMFLLLLAGGAILSGNYPLRAFDAALSRILWTTIWEQRDGRLDAPSIVVPVAGPVA